MRRRAIVGVMAVLAASALVVGMSASIGGASVHSAKVALCAGKTKAAAIKQIKVAYDHFLNGAKYPDASEKEPFIENLSPPKPNAELIALFEASATKNADSSKLTNLKVNKVTCKGKSGKNAAVDFTLIFNGAPLEGIAPADAAAVLSGKTWKVTAETLCNITASGDPSVLESGPCYDILSAP